MAKQNAEGGVERSEADTAGARQYSRGSEFASSKRFGNEIGNEGGLQQRMTLDDPIGERGEHPQRLAVKI